MGLAAAGWLIGLEVPYVRNEHHTRQCSSASKSHLAKRRSRTTAMRKAFRSSSPKSKQISDRLQGTTGAQATFDRSAVWPEACSLNRKRESAPWTEIPALKSLTILCGQ